MGLFSRSKKKSKEEIRQEQEEENIARKVEQQREDHAELCWPGVPKLNGMIVGGGMLSGPDPLDQEQKDKIGDLVFLPNLPVADVQERSLQELLFLLTTLEAFQQSSPLENFEANRSIIVGEIMSRVRNSSRIYVIYDDDLHYPLIDNGMISIYINKERAQLACELFKHQFRNAVVREMKLRNDDGEVIQGNFFDYSYFLGTMAMWLDNGFYRCRIRSFDMAAPRGWDDKKQELKNPNLVFSVLDFLQEAKWKVKYPKHRENIEKKQQRMLVELKKAMLIVPARIQEKPDGPVKVEDLMPKLLMVEAKDKNRYLPVCTDGVEYAKMQQAGGLEGAKNLILDFHSITLLAQNSSGILLNPKGEKLIIKKKDLGILDKIKVLSKAEQEEQARQEQQQKQQEEQHRQTTLGG